MCLCVCRCVGVSVSVRVCVEGKGCDKKQTLPTRKCISEREIITGQGVKQILSFHVQHFSLITRENAVSDWLTGAH